MFRRSISMSLLFIFIVGCAHKYAVERKPASLVSPVSPLKKPLATSFDLKVSSQLKLIKICGKTFQEISWKLSDTNTQMVFKKITLPGSPLAYFVPELVNVRDYAKVADIKAMRVAVPPVQSIQYPPVPDIPITEDGLTEETCYLVKSYYDVYIKSGQG